VSRSNETGARMRAEVQSVYNRQVAKCLDDIAELHELPHMVQERIKRAIEYTCKDVDKLRLQKKNPNGAKTNESRSNNWNR